MTANRFMETSLCNARRQFALLKQTFLRKDKIQLGKFYEREKDNIILVDSDFVRDN